MAVTSAMSAELIAVSFIWTHGVYQSHINPKTSGRRLVYMSHTSCMIYAVIMAGFSIGSYYAGIGMEHLLLMMGNLITSALLESLTLLCACQS